MDDSSDKIGPFGLLPDEMVIYTLSFVHSDALLNCRIVCKRWREFIDVEVFQEKASRENKIHGFNSFSHIHPSFVKKLDLPWFVFYAICKYDPFNRNLVKNNCGQTALEHWTVHPGIYSESIIRKWAIEQTPQGVPQLPDDPDFEGHKSCFRSRSSCSKVQQIIFHEYGLNSNVMKSLQPDILVSDWYAARFDCPCSYTFGANIRNCDGKLLKRFIVTLQWCKSEWIKVSHVFKNQDNAYSVFVNQRMKMDGHYGPKVAGTVVKVLLPTKLKYDNISEYLLY